MPFATAAPCWRFATLGRRGQQAKGPLRGAAGSRRGPLLGLAHQCGAPAIDRRNIAGDQGNTMHLGGRPAGAGVEYVVVALAIALKTALVIARGGHHALAFNGHSAQ